MNFHVASGGVAINFDFQAGRGGGGSCLNCSNKIIKIFPRSLRSLLFLYQSLIFD